MAIALAASGTQATPATPCTVTVSAVADEYLIAGYATDQTDTTDLTSLTSPLVQNVKNSSTYDAQAFYACSGRASGSGSSYSVTHPVGNTLVGAIAVFSGVDTTTAEDTTRQAASSNTGVTGTSGLSFTTVTNGAMIVLVCGVDTAATTNPTFSVDDNGAGLSWSYITAYEASGFRKAVIAYATQASAGAITINGNFGLTAGYGAALYALRPAGGGGGGGSNPGRILLLGVG